MLIPFPEKKPPETMVQSIFVHIVGAKWVSNIKGQRDDCHLRGGCLSTPGLYSHQTAILIWGDGVHLQTHPFSPWSLPLGPKWAHPSAARGLR